MSCDCVSRSLLQIRSQLCAEWSPLEKASTPSALYNIEIEKELQEESHLHTLKAKQKEKDKIEQANSSGSIGRTIEEKSDQSKEQNELDKQMPNLSSKSFDGTVPHFTEKENIHPSNSDLYPSAIQDEHFQQEQDQTEKNEEVPESQFNSENEHHERNEETEEEYKVYIASIKHTYKLAAHVCIFILFHPIYF